MAVRPPAAGAGAGGACAAEHDAVRAQTSDQHHREIGQDVGEVGGVVAGVHDDQDLGIARLPVPGRDQPGHHVPGLAGGDLWVASSARPKRTASRSACTSVPPIRRSTPSASAGEYVLQCAQPQPPPAG